jgi:hypothetical protein
MTPFDWFILALFVLLIIVLDKRDEKLKNLESVVKHYVLNEKNNVVKGEFKTKELEKCRYCNASKDFYESYKDLNAYIDQKHIVLNHYSENGDTMRAIPIKYCPMCGKIL